MVSARCTGDTKGVRRNSAIGFDAIEVGNEVNAPIIQSLYDNTGSSTLQNEASRLDTEMREIKPHSVIQ